MKINDGFPSEFQKNKQSLKWTKLNEEFENKCEDEMKNYYQNIVQDLIESNTGQWYSKVKRMAGQEDDRGEIVTVEELIGFTDDQQAEIIMLQSAIYINQLD